MFAAKFVVGVVLVGVIIGYIYCRLWPLPDEPPARRRPF